MSAVMEPAFVAAPMSEASLAAIATIESDIYEFPWTIGNFRDSLAAGYSCFEYTDALGLAGYAVLSIGAGEAHILNLSVARRAQGNGYGRRILAHLIDRAGEQHAERLILEVRPSNTAARALYAGRGFVRVGVRRGYYPAAKGREDAWVLALDL